jgi:hypothetical protein
VPPLLPGEDAGKIVWRDKPEQDISDARESVKESRVSDSRQITRRRSKGIRATHDVPRLRRCSNRQILSAQGLGRVRQDVEAAKTPAAEVIPSLYSRDLRRGKGGLQVRNHPRVLENGKKGQTRHADSRRPVTPTAGAGRRHPGLLATKVDPAAASAGIGKVGWHTFRHTYSTLLAAFGTAPVVQKELLRHADIRTTLNLYTRAVSKQKRKASLRIARALL